MSSDLVTATETSAVTANSETITVQENSDIDSTRAPSIYSEYPILCISDLHGHLQLLKKAIRHGCKLAGTDFLEVILLGDYCDNGPEIPQLLEYLSCEHWKQEFPRIKLHAILGNHDLACVLAVNSREFNAPKNYRSNGMDYWQRWTYNWMNPGGETPLQYGKCTTQQKFAAKFPQLHYDYLVSLPWFLELDRYIFVHAGLNKVSKQSVEEQLRFLSFKDLRDLRGHTYGGGGYGMPDQLIHKGWARTNDPNWQRIVVTGHNKYAKKYGDDTVDFIDSHRIGFHSCACAMSVNDQLPLHCALLPRGPIGSTTFDLRPQFFGVTESD